MHRPGVELAISRSQVRRSNHYTTDLGVSIVGNDTSTVHSKMWTCYVAAGAVWKAQSVFDEMDVPVNRQLPDTVTEVMVLRRQTTG